jgi:hypothetical protein
MISATVSSSDPLQAGDCDFLMGRPGGGLRLHRLTNATHAANAHMLLAISVFVKKDYAYQAGDRRHRLRAPPVVKV